MAAVSGEGPAVLSALAPLVKQSPTVALVIVLWSEVHQMRQDVERLAAAVAVVVDRDRVVVVGHADARDGG